jgi:hypothetical protein
MQNTSYGSQKRQIDSNRVPPECKSIMSPKNLHSRTQVPCTNYWILYFISSFEFHKEPIADETLIQWQFEPTLNLTDLEYHKKKDIYIQSSQTSSL